MSNELVQITVDEDGADTDNSSWHYVHYPDASPRTLCTGEVFGSGEGSAQYKSKIVSRGGITCSECLKIIKQIKAIKL